MEDELRMLQVSDSATEKPTSDLLRLDADFYASIVDVYLLGGIK